MGRLADGAFDPGPTITATIEASLSEDPRFVRLRVVFVLQAIVRFARHAYIHCLGTRILRVRPALPISSGILGKSKNPRKSGNLGNLDHVPSQEAEYRR